MNAFHRAARSAGGGREHVTRPSGPARWRHRLNPAPPPIGVLVAAVLLAGVGVGIGLGLAGFPVPP